ncbi:hypothetical protein GCM10028801_28380 [Nocardioides maradonensis]
MNTHAEYRRRGYQAPDLYTLQAEAEANELARHRDPSLSAGGSRPVVAPKRVAWVRPTELASYAEPMVGRGIDLHAEFVRRARRAPITTTRAMRQPRPATPPLPTTTPNLSEGLQL